MYHVTATGPSFTTSSLLFSILAIRLHGRISSGQRISLAELFVGRPMIPLAAETAVLMSAARRAHSQAASLFPISYLILPTFVTPEGNLKLEYLCASIRHEHNLSWVCSQGGWTPQQTTTTCTPDKKSETDIISSASPRSPTKDDPREGKRRYKISSTW